MDKIVELPREVFMILRDEKNLTTYCERLEEGLVYHVIELNQGTAFAMDAEGVGIEECWYSPNELKDREIEEFFNEWRHQFVEDFLDKGKQDGR